MMKNWLNYVSFFLLPLKALTCWADQVPINQVEIRSAVSLTVDIVKSIAPATLSFDDASDSGKIPQHVDKALKLRDSENFQENLVKDLLETKHVFLESGSASRPCAKTTRTGPTHLVEWYLPNCKDEHSTRLSIVLFLIGESIHHFDQGDNVSNIFKMAYKNALTTDYQEVFASFSLNEPFVANPKKDSAVKAAFFKTQNRLFEHPRFRDLKDGSVFLIGVDSENNFVFTRSAMSGYEEVRKIGFENRGTFFLNSESPNILGPRNLANKSEGTPSLSCKNISLESSGHEVRIKGVCTDWFMGFLYGELRGRLSAEKVFQVCFHKFEVEMTYNFDSTGQRLFGVSYIVKKPSVIYSRIPDTERPRACEVRGPFVSEAEFIYLNLEVEG